MGISVVIPVYNREQYLELAIRSVVNQEFYGELEIIISDDGSTDGSLDIAESFGNSVRVLKKPIDCNEQGPAATRNRGIKICSHEYICFLDSDDFYLPDHLKKMISAIQSDDDVGFAFCRVLEMDVRRGIGMYRAWTKPKILRRDIINLVISDFSVVTTNSFIIKKAVFDKIGLFNEEYSNGEDTDMWMRLCENYSGTFSSHYGAVHRRHGLNQLTDNNKREVFKSHYEIYRKALNRNGLLNINNFYRTYRLFFLCMKFGWLKNVKGFDFFINYYYDFKETQIIEANIWFPLKYFFKS